MADTFDATNSLIDSQADGASGARKKSRNIVGETTMQIFRVGGLTDITSSEYAELRNYIYGINGRY